VIENGNYSASVLHPDRQLPVTEFELRTSNRGSRRPAQRPRC